MSLLCARDLSKVYGVSGYRTIGVDHVDLDVEKGEFICIMGKSGSGKTTLLKMLGTIESPTMGEISMDGKNYSKMSSSEIAELRRKKIGFVFQDINLMNSLTAGENIMLPLILDHADLQNAQEVILNRSRLFGIDYALSKNPTELSGGEKQKVAILRALSNNPELIFADEPTGNLDSKSSDSVIHCFELLNQDFHKTIIMVTHDSKIASYASRVLIMKDGNLEGDISKQGNSSEFKEVIEKKFAKIFDL